MKVITVVGTRPEIIRLSRVIVALDGTVDHVVVHTGQNWDPQLRDVFFAELGLRKPDYDLSIDTSSLGQVMGGILCAIEPILLDEQPDAVLILGDTNSSIAALMAKRLAIPVFHMEAGNRSFDENVPEETNRRMIDHIADFNLCYTEHARRNLLAEGLPARRTFVTGSPMAEVLDCYNDLIESSTVIEDLGLRHEQFLLVSMHREENIDNPQRLFGLLTAILRLQEKYACQVVVTTHPRLRLRLSASNLALPVERMRFLEPFGFLDYNKLQRHSLCVLSDSGTISEESAICGFPAVTIRNSMERPEALDAGSIVLTGLSPEGIERAVKLVVDQVKEGFRPARPPEYTWTDCSARVVRLITGLAEVHADWLHLASKESPQSPESRPQAGEES